MKGYLASHCVGEYLGNHLIWEGHSEAQVGSKIICMIIALLGKCCCVLQGSGRASKWPVSGADAAVQKLL